MQHPAPTQPSPAFSGFAGLLATLAAPPPDAAGPAPPWSSSDLGEDVATLSYERALRAHARYRPANPIDPAGQIAHRDAVVEDSSSLPARAAEAPPAADECSAAPAPQSAALSDRDLRLASVTIRLSKAECARLHQRAAEAGLTVSAYLRSCALEAEALRAEVKQALAELKAGSAPARPQAGGELLSRGGESAKARRSEAIRLTRVLAHIGKLWVGLSSGNSA